ncbi:MULTISPECIES: universal stress protein [Rhodococcus]|jgi:nucleotide-binding universal stress UspA family protein|uniref:Universal stress protein n=1 Tax=Rhodococcus cercidiphylli TaxID=489916 RepID=A0ABU4ARP5_9NOCA|nr:MULTISPECIES: universal stress protein [Rhodococcus]MDV6228913.1 universal stress protein [Rhodococcus cercidiphylli]MDV7987709.1 universal stress protein [Rhodococcus sp. IEGM 1374]
MKITVGYLATPSGDDGVALATALARALDASIDIVLVMAVDEPVMEGSGPYRKVLAAKAEGWVADAAAQVPSGIEVTTHVLSHESFARALIDFAVQTDADMIVVGGAGDGLLNRHSVGSVAGQLLHASEVPLALAPRGYRLSNAPITDLTVAVPTRASAPNPLPFAITIASAAHVPVRLVSLVSLEPTGAPSDETSLDTRRRQVAAAQDNLELAVRTLPDIDGLESIVADGSSLDEAMGNLDWKPGDVLFLGSSRLATPKRVFLGSSAAKILRAAPVPVIVVPHD